MSLRPRRPWAVSLVAAVVCASAAAHETDQYTVPAGMEFAELGAELTAMYYDGIEAAVNSLNGRIARAMKAGRSAARLAWLQSPETLSDEVYARYKPAFFMIEGWDYKVHHGLALRRKYPGKITGHWESVGNIFTGVYFPLDYRQFFRIWHACTMKAFGTCFGVDKLGHFTDMGWVSYTMFRSGLGSGAGEQETMAKILAEGRQGLILGEEGMLGYLSSGLYSNADLAANFAGFKFYMNLTREVRVKGTLLAPMVRREGDFWRISPHVRRDSAFVSWFFSDHFNEALNPGVFEPGMREHVRESVRQRAGRFLEFYADPNGSRRTRAWFEAKRAELASWYGEDYGHRGCGDEVVTIAAECFQAPPGDGGPEARNAAGWTRLHWAAASGDRALALEALEAGADVNAPVRSLEQASGEWGSTALHLAAASGSAEVVDLLIQQGARIDQPNARGATALHRAVEYPRVVRLLLEHEADPNAADEQGRCPLHWLAPYAAIESARLLVNAGADVSAADHRGQTPLHLGALHGNVTMMEFLLACRASPDTRAELGATPLCFAVRGGAAAAVEVLLRGGARPDAADEFGLSPLHEAARAGNQEMVAALLEAGAMPSSPDCFGTTPLHVAARQGYEAIAGMLIQGGADVNAPNRNGSRPLHEAVLCARNSLLNLLLTNGADTRARDGRGRSAADLASAGGQTMAFLLLASVLPGGPTGIQ